MGRREVVDLVVSEVDGKPEGAGGLTRGLEDGAK